MVNEQSIFDVVQEFNKDRTRTFAEFIAEVFKGEFVEIYLGDSYEEISTEQVSTAYPAVFCGQVIAAYRECLVLKCVYTEHRLPALGKFMFLSERAIRGLTPIDGKGTIEDMFLRSKESLDIKEMFADRLIDRLKK